MLVSIEEDECSKIMLSIPKDRFKFETLQKTASFKDEHFLASHSVVKIKAGSSKITLDELKNLSTEDIILLENSNSTKLTLVSGELVKQFNIKADPSLILNIDTADEDEDEDNKRVLSNDEVTMEKNLWDDIQIEINAEFEKVKMTIGELKQITQGQIVDLGSVFDSEISLFVEDKVVAKGELVIINDKYAVKVNKVFSPQQQAQAKPAAATAAKPAPKPATAAKPAPPNLQERHLLNRHRQNLQEQHRQNLHRLVRHLLNRRQNPRHQKKTLTIRILKNNNKTKKGKNKNAILFNSFYILHTCDGRNTLDCLCGI